MQVGSQVGVSCLDWRCEHPCRGSIIAAHVAPAIRGYLVLAALVLSSVQPAVVHASCYLCLSPFPSSPSLPTPPPPPPLVPSVTALSSKSLSPARLTTCAPSSLSCRLPRGASRQGQGRWMGDAEGGNPSRGIKRQQECIASARAELSLPSSPLCLHRRRPHILAYSSQCRPRDELKW